MALTFEQFQKLRQKGLSNDQIVKFEKGEKPKKEVFSALKEKGINPAREALLNIQPALRAIPEQYTEPFTKHLESPAFSYVNQFLGDNPRQIALKLGYKMPEENLVSRGAGIAGAFGLGSGVANIAKQLTTQAPKQVAKKIGGPVAMKTARFISRPGSMRAALQGAITGGITAPFYSPKGDPFNVGKRVSTIPFGAGLGALVGTALHGGSKIVKFIKDRRKPTYVQKASGEKGVPFKDLTPEERISNRQFRAEKEAQAKIGRRTAYKTQLEDELRKTTTNVDDYLTKAKQDLSNISQKKGIAYKSKLNQFSKEFGENYGQAVDDIGEKISLSGKKIMRDDAVNIIEDTISSLTDDALPVTPKIQRLLDKYSKLKTKDIPIREFLSDMKSLTKRTAESVFKGTKARSEEQVSETVLKHKLGDYLATLSDDFKPLQAKASEILNATKLLRKGIQPKDIYATEKAAKFTQKYATDIASKKPDLGTKKAVTMLEKGTDLSGKPIKGAGNVSREVVSVAKRINNLEKALKNKKTFTETEVARVQKDIDNIKKILDSRQNQIIRGFAGKQRYGALKRRLHLLQNIVKYSLIASGAKASVGAPRTIGRIYGAESE